MTDQLPVPTATNPKRAQMERAYSDAIGRLTDQQRRYVEALLESGDPKAALAEAGIVARDGLRRMNANPRVAAAIKAGRALRAADAAMQREDVESMLEQMAQTRLEDLLVLNDKGVPIDARDWRTLPTGMQRAVKRMRCTTERTKLGTHAKLVRIEVELWNPHETLKQLAQLRGWAAPDGPTIDLNLYGQGAVVNASAGGGKIHEEIADAVLTDAELAEWDALPDERAKLAFIREKAMALRRWREERDKA